MKRSVAIFLCTALGLFFFAQEVSAFPGHHIVGRAAHVAHKAGHKIHGHVTQPVRRITHHHHHSSHHRHW